MLLPIILPLASGFVYAVAALCLKRATEEGFGITRLVFLFQGMTFLLFLPALTTSPVVLDWSHWWWALVAATFEFLGAICIVISIRIGAISIQTPLMGTKVLFVATASLILIPAPIPIQWWFGALLTFLAVMILGLPDVLKRLTSPQAIFYTIASAALFAIADVLVAREAPLFGRTMFVFLFFLFLALETVVLIPFFRQGITKTSRRAWKWALSGSLLMALQLVGLFYALAFFGQATVLNVLYGARGFWSILIIWFVGHWFGNKEKDVGKSVMLRRFGGATLLFLAIVVILYDF